MARCFTHHTVSHSQSKHAAPITQSSKQSQSQNSHYRCQSVFDSQSEIHLSNLYDSSTHRRMTPGRYDIRLASDLRGAKCRGSSWTELWQ
eukprot:6717238-Pyramimonas_sp.AAC.1